MCRDGRRQSPINVDPRTLLFDPNLSPFTVDKTSVRLVTPRGGSEGSNPLANMSGGPLSYTYSLTHTRLHFGDTDQQGSEHLLDGRPFPAELQIYGYNSQLYQNFSEASSKVYGVAAIAIFLQIGDAVSPELQVMLGDVKAIKYGGSSVRTSPVRVDQLVPSTQQYMTYEGSTTEPACHETVTWILPNKPVYITRDKVGERVTRDKLEELRGLRQSSAPPLTHATLANNFRPAQTAHHRTVRANIQRRPLGEETRCHIADPRFAYRGE
ncbi:carbonic anhydrase alpha, 4-like [Hyalella azteca]|uniref:Carbonic anhydrase alpha, 4-like n=1 Tax=Hyalella azteca TaxID=294128 RepID=A0A6A0H617_HYAAZ|nr:carbonic anhydrase alpha, 4-like [Hyalella azteca]